MIDAGRTAQQAVWRVQEVASCLRCHDAWTHLRRLTSVGPGRALSLSLWQLRCCLIQPLTLCHMPLMCHTNPVSHDAMLCCSDALAAIQRQLEEASSRAREAEEQQLLAAAEAARLQQQVRRTTCKESAAMLIHAIAC